MPAEPDRMIKVGDCDLHVRRKGQGTPLLYLHGTEGLTGVAPALGALAQTFDLIAPDHPGYGLSGDAAAVDTMSDLAMFYLDVLDQMGLEQVHVVGHSMGGWLALEIAVRNSHRLASLTLVGSAGIHVQGVDKGDLFICTPEEGLALLNHDADAARLRQQASLADADARMVYRNRVTTAKLCWQPRLFNPSLARWLHRVQLPTLLLWGENDQVLPPAYGEALARSIAGARLVMVPSCGHMLPFEQPARFNDEVTAFIRSLAA
jgi:pimeloyl-ACP methyl ester carboxylesterase